MAELSAQVLHSETLDFNADCAEFCPVPGLTHLLALGTYQLIEERQERVGRCYLHQLQQAGDSEGGPEEQSGGQGSTGESGESAGTHSCRVSALDLPGIFDLKWRPPGDEGPADRAMLGAALADGSVRLLEAVAPDWDAGGGAPAAPSALRQVGQVAACSSGMSLSLDWQVRPAAGAGKGPGGAAAPAAAAASARIATSSSSGHLAVVQVREGSLQVLSEWQAHSLEAWCAAFDRTEGHLLFSGADDCHFKAYDLRADPGSAPVFCDRRTHTAGVCTVSPHPSREHLVATGSYDEHVRLWDTRNCSRPVVVAEATTGGGNWRLRWHPRDGHLLLAACMYNGFGLLRAGPDFGELEVVGMLGSPNKHIAYGVDWWQGPDPLGARPAGGPGSGHGLIATCSYYDQLYNLVQLRLAD